MAIEFRCIRCGQLLRVDGADHGKRARCPTCNAIVDIPVEDLPSSPIAMSREKSDVIDYELFGEENQHVEITLDPGEITVARLESLLWMSPGIAMDDVVTDDSGGSLLGKLSQVGRRILSGSSLRMTAFCNVAEQREVVAFSPSLSGRLIPQHLDEHDNQIVCRGDAILCVARGIEITDIDVAGVSSVATMQRMSGDGIAVLQSNGQVFHRPLGAKKTLIVKTDSIVAFTSQMTITPHECVRVDESISVSEVSGPGEVWLQTGV